MEYRLDKYRLLETLEQWNRFLKRKVHLIACGGTAMTLLDVKASTKDVDFMVPNVSEYAYLIKVLKSLDYEPETSRGWLRKGDVFRFDLFPGKKIHTTELLETPLAPENHFLLKEYSRLYIGILSNSSPGKAGGFQNREPLKAVCSKDHSTTTSGGHASVNNVS